ncbi:MAG: DUF3572 family protein [Parasphingorhabdus sp.]|nr:DUF3572 family protein [Parasphingorhabdus sp.]
MLETNTNNNADPVVTALAVLGWVLQDGDRAGRLLAMTGLDPRALRDGLEDPALLAALLGFVAGHEPDLVACAAALDQSPAALVAAARALDPASEDHI